MKIFPLSYTVFFKYVARCYVLFIMLASRVSELSGSSTFNPVLTVQACSHARRFSIGVENLFSNKSYKKAQIFAKMLTILSKSLLFVYLLYKKISQ